MCVHPYSLIIAAKCFFHGWSQPRNYFNSEIFLIYSNAGLTPVLKTGLYQNSPQKEGKFSWGEVCVGGCCTLLGSIPHSLFFGFTLSYSTPSPPPTTQACILCEPQKLAVRINLSAGADLAWGFRQSVCNFERDNTKHKQGAQEKGMDPYTLVLIHCSKYVLIYLTCEACLVMVAHM